MKVTIDGHEFDTDNAPGSRMEEHTKPAITWGAEDWRAPKPHADETVLFDECGRTLLEDVGGRQMPINYTSHWLRVFKPRIGNYVLAVKHGGGEERIPFGHNARVIAALAAMDSDTRYRVLYVFLDMHSDAARTAAQHMAEQWRKAFVDGRLKKRKHPGQDRYKVWIESPRKEA